MASIIVKWQKCGKTGCRCTEGMPHGPYFWLVKYIRISSHDRRRGKYSWKYLGKKPIDAWEKVNKLDNRFRKTFDLKYFNRKVKELNQRRELGSIQKSTEKIMTVDDLTINQ